MNEHIRKKRMKLNVATNIALRVVTLVYGFLLAKVIIYKYGSDVNGLVNSITNFLAYITLLESGFGPVIKSLLYKPIAKNDSETIRKILSASEGFFRKISYIFIAYVVGLAIFYPLIVGREFDFVATSILVIILAIGVFVEYYFGITYEMFLQAEQKNYVVSLIKIVSYAVSTILVLVMAKLDVSLYIMELACGIVFLMKTFSQKLYVRKKYGIKTRLKEEYKIKQKWDGLAQHIAYAIHTNTDIVVLTLFSTLSEVSVYAVYYLAVKGVKSVVKAFSTGLDATFGDMLARGKDIKDKFGRYELLYFTVSTICFASLIVMITPFVSVYTRSITDADYIRVVFGYLIVIGEFIWAVRQPYEALVKVVGRFKETRKMAWVECAINVVLSVALVWNYGLVGVAIGTLVAMTVRAIDLIYHSNKYVLKRSIMVSFRKIALIVVETVLIVVVANLLPMSNNVNYVDLAINGTMVLAVATVITTLINLLFTKKEITLWERFTVFLFEHRYFLTELFRGRKKKFARMINDSYSIKDKRSWIKKFNKVVRSDLGAVNIAEEFFKSEIEIIKDRRVLPTDIIAICLERNDLIKLKKVISHHRKLGVDKFVVIDNCSDDGSVEYLLKQKDVVLLRAREQYSPNRQEAWINRVIAHYGDNRWYLVVDSDELLVYYKYKEKNIRDLISYYEENKIVRARAMLLDMYAKPSYYTDGRAENYYKECVFFDTDSYRRSGDHRFKCYVGGPRERVFGVSPYLTKYPLFYFRKKDIRINSHCMYPYLENFRGKCRLILKHYKFLPGEKEKIEQMVRDKIHYNDSIQYRYYLDGIRKGRFDYFCDSTCEYKNDESLEEINAYKKIDWDE